VNVHALRSFRDGWFELQDEGSQLIAMVVEPSPGETVVDACAGGGGKTLHLAALMKNIGVLVSVDLEERRLKNLRGRAGRAGVTMATVMRTGPDLLGSYRRKADAVLVDAPCSGVGTFRRNPGAKLKFSEDFVSTVCRTQRRLLEDSAELVKPGGRLVYATCSLLRQENETAVESFLSKHTEFALQHVAPILRRHAVTADDSTPFLLLLPHRTTTDGFFAAAMIRKLS
jgi:16S rRNA (cytosine967-C5)-methyltransferase